ncbi:MAG: hypothetical protein MZV70_66010 [Desulfobacterales bacterium]|nr:hypothetical protein [Desulfobacterales bacterium]
MRLGHRKRDSRKLHLRKRRHRHRPGQQRSHNKRRCEDQQPTQPVNGLPRFHVSQHIGLDTDGCRLRGQRSNQSAFANARVEIFQSDNDGSGYGEGQLYLGFLTTDANGNISGSLTVSGLNVGDRITGTATDGSTNTSEFGPNFTGYNAGDLRHRVRGRKLRWWGGAEPEYSPGAAEVRPARRPGSSCSTAARVHTSRLRLRTARTATTHSMDLPPATI